MLLRSTLLAAVAVILSISVVFAVSPKKIAVDLDTQQDCSDPLLHWKWRPAPGQAQIKYGIQNLDTGVFQGLFQGPSVSEGQSEASHAPTEFILTASQPHRFVVSTQLFDSGGNLLLFSEKIIVLPCDGP